jgi:hypothetical protein
MRRGWSLSERTGSRGVVGANVNTQRKVWTVQAPPDGAYRVMTSGDFLGVGVNSQLWLGHQAPLHGAMVPITAAGLALLVVVLVLAVGWVRGRSRSLGVTA